MTEVAHFSIDYTKILNENGTLVSTLPEFAKEINHLICLYEDMYLLRIFDQKGIALQRTGKMGTYASTLGQEAITCAVGDALKPEDVLVPFYRDYGAMLKRGVKMSEIYTYWGGDERGAAYENQPSDFPIAVPIASQCLHATGLGFAFQYRQEKRVALVSIGDGGTSEGDFYEALNVAGAWNLPVVFVVNNNQWAISVPLSKQTKAQTIAQKAIAAGIPGEQVDGNDIIATRYRIGEAIEKARSGGGPTLIEALTYRLCDHTTADDASRYRPAAELQEAQKKEPLIRLRTYLEAQNAWSAAQELALEEKCKIAVNKAVEDYLNRTPQKLNDIFDYQYQITPSDLNEQKEAALAFQEKIGV